LSEVWIEVCYCLYIEIHLRKVLGKVKRSFTYVAIVIVSGKYRDAKVVGVGGVYREGEQGHSKPLQGGVAKFSACT